MLKKKANIHKKFKNAIIKDMKQKIDFLAIGDVLTDAFIHLQDAQVHCNIDNAACTITLPFW